MATQTQISVAKDPTGLVTRTTTKQSLTWEDPSADARSYNVTQVDGIVTIVEENFDQMPPVYALDVSSTQEPVESHPYFAELTPKQRRDWALWKQNPNNPDLNGYNPENDEDGKMVTLFLLWQKGITNYLAPRIVIKCTTLEDSDPSAADVGRISETGYGGNTGSVDFLLTGLSGQQEGSKWRVTREYLGSANGSVWETVLYSG